MELELKILGGTGIEKMNWIQKEVELNQKEGVDWQNRLHPCMVVVKFNKLPIPGDITILTCMCKLYSRFKHLFNCIQKVS